MQIAACFWSKLHQIIGCIRNLDAGSYLCVLCQLHTNFSSIDCLFTQSLFHYLVVIYVTGTCFSLQLQYRKVDSSSTSRLVARLGQQRPNAFAVGLFQQPNASAHQCFNQASFNLPILQQPNALAPQCFSNPLLQQPNALSTQCFSDPLLQQPNDF